MGIFNKISRKCIFCGDRAGVKYVPSFGIYGGHVAGNWYHDLCLKAVLGDPEKYGHNKVDMALAIVERLERVEEELKEEELGRERKAKKSAEALRKLNRLTGKDGK